MVHEIKKNGMNEQIISAAYAGRALNEPTPKYTLPQSQMEPGVGWVVWRDRSELPEELIFHVNYLGGDMPTFTLNFSRPGNQIVGQYYYFIRLGFDGYREIMQALQIMSNHLSSELENTWPFEMLHDGTDIPVLAFRVTDPSFTCFDVSAALRSYGWQVPAYTMPENIQDVAVLRIVVREGFSREMADNLLGAFARAVKRCRGEAQARPVMFSH